MRLRKLVLLTGMVVLSFAGVCYWRWEVLRQRRKDFELWDDDDHIRVRRIYVLNDEDELK